MGVIIREISIYKERHPVTNLKHVVVLSSYPLFDCMILDFNIFRYTPRYTRFYCVEVAEYGDLWAADDSRKKCCKIRDTKVICHLPKILVTTLIGRGSITSYR
uniref:Uncharacterized protein n=1 Tax=Vespula pensylvanica TaxID=30213 RepID=A0A836UUD9_VESPE|nr:hypothetical protein H0235_014246 [Vespula pensylvanica]